MRKLLLGMGYLTWICCNLAVVYGIGWGAVKLYQSSSVGEFILHLAVGMIMLMLLVILSGLCLGLLASLFGDEKVAKKVIDWFPFID
jgi:heme A synthase